jgi:hypothetical protein
MASDQLAWELSGVLQKLRPMLGSASDFAFNSS